MKNIKMIRQHDHADCGAACLLMISLYFNKKHSLCFMRELTHTDQNGTTFQGICEGAEKIGINAEGYKASTEELSAYLKKEKKPVIVHFKKNHYAIVYRMAKKKVFLADPGEGMRIIPLDKFSECWSGHMLVFTNQGKDVLEEKTDRSAFFWDALGASWKEALCMLFMSVLTLTISIGMSYLFEILYAFYDLRIRRYVGKRSNPFTYILANIAEKDIYALFFFVIIAVTCAATLLYLKGMVSARLAKRLDGCFMAKYAEKLLNVGPGELHKRSFGDYASRLSDLIQVRRLFSDIPISILVNLFLLVPGSILLIRISPPLFLLLALMLFLYVILFFAVSRPRKAMTHNAMGAAGGVQSYFKELIQGSEAITTYNLENRVHTLLMEKYNDMTSRGYKVSLVGYAGLSGGFLIEQVGNLLILFTGFEFVQSNVISLGELVTFIMLLELVSDSAKQLVLTLLEVQGCQVSLERVEDIFCAKGKDENKGVSLEHVKEIQLKDVSFSYFGDSSLLSKISLSISGKKKLAVVGENGTGKSTLLKIIMGLEKPESGCVLYNGLNSENVKMSDIYNRVAYVPQTPFLFADTLYFNVTLGEEYSEDDVMKACIAAGLEDYLQKSLRGMESFIDENGANLSQGQMQSVALARALIRKPEILVLDEATSHMDPEKEKMVMEGLMQLPIPCVFVTHNTIMAEMADVIIRI